MQYLLGTNPLEDAKVINFGFYENPITIGDSNRSEPPDSCNNSYQEQHTGRRGRERASKRDSGENPTEEVQFGLLKCGIVLQDNHTSRNIPNNKKVS